MSKYRTKDKIEKKYFFLGIQFLRNNEGTLILKFENPLVI